MTDVYLSLGSNLGSRHAQLVLAIDLLARRVGRLVRASSFFETEPWGFTSPNTFLNAAVLLRTTLTPRQVLEETQAIERLLGRTRKTPSAQTAAQPLPSGSEAPPAYADRPIDIDILLYGDEHVDAPDLKIPHPLMNQREFVLRPLREIKAE